MPTADSITRLVGLGTYAYFWRWHVSAERPLSLLDMVSQTAELGVRRFQICDYPELERYDDAGLDRLRQHAAVHRVALELGTRGLAPAHLGRFLALAQRLDATLVRSMVNAVGSRPSTEQARDWLRAVMPTYERAGVTLALETYEQVPVPTLVDLVGSVGSPCLGVCLDPANSVAALEHPTDTVERTADLVRNLHVKDFHFTRQDGWVGFSLVGCPLGEGQLPYGAMLDRVRPLERGISMIIEHWLPWQGDTASTIAVEDQWTRHNLHHLRSTL